MPPEATAISARNARFWVVFLLRLEGDEAALAEGVAWGRSIKKALAAAACRVARLGYRGSTPPLEPRLFCKTRAVYRVRSMNVTTEQANQWRT